MITFLVGLAILLLGYIFYSKYVEKQFEPKDLPTPAHKINDKIDYIPMGTKRNALIQLLNIAGLGPLLGAVQGILFGPITFILIPLGCIFMGGVHDYFSGMISVRDDGLQITGIIKKYLGSKFYIIFMIIACFLLPLVCTVFLYTSGDLIAERFLHETNFSLSNPTMIVLYSLVLSYFIIAALFPVDKIIGKFYPIFGFILVLGTILVLIGFLTNGVDLQNIDIKNINLHPKHLAIIPFFFMTVSCGLLSGFHATQSTIISRTLNSEYDGKKVFYGMMCIEAFIAMIWAAGAMHVYAHNIVPTDLIGKVNVLNIIINNFVPAYLGFLVTIALVVLPITTGDTALRSLRLMIAEALGWKKTTLKRCLIILIPILILIVINLYMAKMNNEAFFLLWRYFTFTNQLIATVMFSCATVFLYKMGKNYYITLIPQLFCFFVTMTFILNAKIGFDLNMNLAEIIAVMLTIANYIILKKIMIEKEADVDIIEKNGIKDPQTLEKTENLIH